MSGPLTTGDIVTAWHDVPIGGSFVWVAKTGVRYVVTRIGENQFTSSRETEPKPDTGETT